MNCGFYSELIHFHSIMSHVRNKGIFYLLKQTISQWMLLLLKNMFASLQNIPWCEKCDPRTPLSIMKPDIVFFGESLPEEFHNQMSLDKDECDLLIVIGSSLKVRPVALIPSELFF